MSEYLKKAKTFLKKAQATMLIEYVGCDIPLHWQGEKEKHNHYQFTIVTPRGEMTDNFWDSLINTKLSQMTLDQYCIKHHRMPYAALWVGEKWQIKKDWETQVKNAIPNEYDILACLTQYVPDTFEEFCEEFGYSNDSISALKTYLACQEEAAKLKKIFTKEQLEELEEIW